MNDIILQDFAENFSAIVREPKPSDLAYLWFLLSHLDAPAKSVLNHGRTRIASRANQFQAARDNREQPLLGADLAVDLAAFAVTLDDVLFKMHSVRDPQLVSVGAPDPHLVRAGVARDTRDFWIVARQRCGERKPVPFRSRARSQGRIPEALFSFHKIIPQTLPDGIKVKIRTPIGPNLSQAEARKFADRVGKRGFVRVYAAVFSDWAYPFQRRFDDNGFVFEELHHRESERLREIRTHLRRAFQKRADLIIFPELSIPPSLYEPIGGELRELSRSGGHYAFLTLAGSWHEATAGHQLGSQEHLDYYNSAPVLGPVGKEIFRHRKLVNFSEDEIKEYILTPNSLTMLDTDIGLFAVAICKDAGDDNAIANVWRYAQPDWVLVPSLGGDTTENLLKKGMSNLVGLRGAIGVVARQDNAGAMLEGQDQNWGRAWIRTPQARGATKSPKAKVPADVGRSDGLAYVFRHVTPPWWEKSNDAR